MPGSLHASLVSILVPLYNEEEYVAAILCRVLSAPLPEGMQREIVVVDDASTDGSAEVVERLEQRHPGVIRLIRQDRNRGKGAAIRRAVAEARGEFCLIQDADLEYDPRDYLKLLKPLVEGRADAVYGSRFLVSGERRVLYYWHALANSLLTGLCNMAADLNLTDMETCYKAFRTSLLKSIPIRSDRFGFEPEITIKLAKRQARVYETPVSYHGRTYEEGKKIGLKDAIEAFFLILRYRLSSDIYADSGQGILHTFSAAPSFNRWMADTIRPYLGSSVLEIGAGIGNLTRLLARGRERYVATDIDREHLTRLGNRLQHRPNLETAECDIGAPGALQQFSGQMDTVVCLNVLEHIPDDMAALANMRSAVRPGGRVIILVPEGQEIYGTLDEALEHCRRYAESELRGKLENAGFTVERIVAFNRVSRPGWYVNGRLLKRRSISPFQLKLIDRTVWLWRLVDGRLPWKPTSLIAVARKPE